MKNWMKTALALGLAIGLVDTANAAGSQSDDVSWTLPTQRVDGTPLPVSELATTEIEVTRDGAVVATNGVPAPGTSWTLARELPPNYTLCYRARVVDTDGLVSDWSAEVCKTVKGKPRPPSVDQVR